MGGCAEVEDRFPKAIGIFCERETGYRVCDTGENPVVEPGRQTLNFLMFGIGYLRPPAERQAKQRAQESEPVCALLRRLRRMWIEPVECVGQDALIETGHSGMKLFIPAAECALARCPALARLIVRPRPFPTLLVGCDCLCINALEVRKVSSQRAV